MMNRNARLKQGRRSHGFTLIEMILVLAVMGAVTITSMAWLTSERERTLRDSAVSDQAREVATLTRALDTYLEKATSLPATGSFDVTQAELVSAGLLPSNFAMRIVGSDRRFVSPTYQPYQMRASKVGTKYRGAVFVSFDASTQGLTTSAFSRMGMQNTEQGQLDFSTLVMRRINRQFIIPSALIRPGQITSDLDLSGFSQDFSNMLSGAAAVPVMASLAGFSELAANPDVKVSIDPESLAGIGNGGGGGSSTGTGMCYVSSTGACASGYAEVYSYQTCAKWGRAGEAAGEPLTAVAKTSAGDITIQRSTSVTYGSSISYVQGPKIPLSHKITGSSRVGTSQCYDPRGSQYAGMGTQYNAQCYGTGAFASHVLNYSSTICDNGPAPYNSDGTYPALSDCASLFLSILSTDLGATPYRPYVGASVASLIGPSRSVTSNFYAYAFASATGVTYVGEVADEIPTCNASDPLTVSTPIYGGIPTQSAGYSAAIPSLSPPKRQNTWAYQATAKSYTETVSFGGAQVASALCEDSLLTQGTGTLLSTMAGQARSVSNTCALVNGTRPWQAYSARPNASGLPVLKVCCQ